MSLTKRSPRRGMYQVSDMNIFKKYFYFIFNFGQFLIKKLDQKKLTINII